MQRSSIKVVLAALISPVIMAIPHHAEGAVLTANTVWQGNKVVTEDIVIPQGVTLTIKAGTVIKISPSDSTKTDPEYLSPLTEITVRGTLKAEGTQDAPVIFMGGEKNQDAWAGIFIDGGTAQFQSSRIHHAESGIYVINGAVQVEGSLFKENRYGLVVTGEKSRVTVSRSLLSENEYGLVAAKGTKIEWPDTRVTGNRKRDVYSMPVKDFISDREYDIRGEDAKGEVHGDEVLPADTIWQGRIIIKGNIMVPEGSRLAILPGTVVEFMKKDTNGDGIGENGFLIQGVLIAKGTKDKPIIFRSGEKQRGMGDWDAINIMNSDGAQNLIEYCQIEDAYRGLHFHFSNVAVTNSVLRNNYRGLQFQESTVELRENHLYGNKSGIQGRDSDVAFTDNTLSNNYYGAHFFRNNLTARHNTIVNNYRDGVRIREGVPTMEENLIDGNRYGLMVSDAFYGVFSRNVITNNGEIGFSIKKGDNLEVSGNFIGGNGLNGLNIQEARALVKRNHISDNGERGIGIASFDGLITENNFIHNGLYAIDLDGASDVAAPLNWWGDEDVEKVVYDKADDPSKGRVRHETVQKEPFAFTWPLQGIQTDVTWRGVIAVTTEAKVQHGSTLTIEPKTRVEFSRGAGLDIRGKIIARGESDKKITFTSSEKRGAGDWDELLLEYATGSVIAHCIFEYATWGIHSHFTDLALSDSYFTRNYGGMRFRSGPVAISRSVFENNSIGIRSYRGNALIVGNVITKNEVGIFVREKGSGLRITRNNLFANDSYNIRIGDFNDEDVDARENWWGAGNPVDTIFDGRREPEIGLVIYEPYLKEPLQIEAQGIK